MKAMWARLISIYERYELMWTEDGSGDVVVPGGEQDSPFYSGAKFGPQVRNTRSKTMLLDPIKTTSITHLYKTRPGPDEPTPTPN